MHPFHPFHRVHGRVPSGRSAGGGGLPPEFAPHHGGRRARVFESGDVKLLILCFLAERPRHGYEIIKAIGDLVGGEYSPSPGVVYPTLTLLEDIGHASSTVLDDGRREYRITAQGTAHLEAQAGLVESLLSRLDHGRSRARARGVPEIRRAMENLKTALRLRFSEESPDAETLRRLAEIIDRAAVEIGRS
jgi:DNA-binding PadR family transcriptional regulator